MLSPPSKDAARIAGMFDAIAPRYDFLNHLLSAGFDRRWRARAITALALDGRETVLDLCTGTGDLALAALQSQTRAARVIGVDFSSAMLHIAQEKTRRAGLQRSVPLLRADASRLPIREASVDVVTIAFGIRNVENPELACAEMCRVLRAGGRLAVLEFSVPKLPGLQALYLWYFRRVLPLVGRLVSKHRSAYSYLPESVGAFPPPDEFAHRLRSAGFDRVTAVPLTFGVVYMFMARKAVSVRATA